MSPIVVALLIVGGIGLVAALVLAIASAVLAVPTNEKAEKIQALLPGANCGGCGFSGCEAYALALAEGRTEGGLCSPGGQEVADAIAEIIGQKVVLQKKVAVVRCTGCHERSVSPATYHNVKRCSEAAKLYGGAKSCSYGCLGLADCERACPHGAIKMENGLARVDSSLCVGCGVCVVTCPKGLLALALQKPLVACRNTDKGAVTRKVCKTGCLGCGKCVKVCPNDAIHLQNNLAVINPELCVQCGACAVECPVGCILTKI